MNTLIQREVGGRFGSILVVDDDVTLVRSVGRVLKLFRPVLSAHSGTEVLGLFEASEPPPRLCGALIDVKLGEGPDGLTLVREIRARYPHIPILILTGELTEEACACAYDQRALLLKKGTAELRLKTFGLACLVADLEPEERVAEIVAEEAVKHGFSPTEIEAVVDALHNKTGAHYRDVLDVPLPTYRARTGNVAKKTGQPFSDYIHNVLWMALARDRLTSF